MSLESLREKIQIKNHHCKMLIKQIYCILRNKEKKSHTLHIHINYGRNVHTI